MEGHLCVRGWKVVRDRVVVMSWEGLKAKHMTATHSISKNWLNGAPKYEEAGKWVGEQLFSHDRQLCAIEGEAQVVMESLKLN